MMIKVHKMFILEVAIRYIRTLLSNTHQFTGSVNITGSISLNGQAIGTGKLDESWFNTYVSSSTSTIASSS